MTIPLLMQLGNLTWKKTRVRERPTGWPQTAKRLRTRYLPNLTKLLTPSTSPSTQTATTLQKILVTGPKIKQNQTQRHSLGNLSYPNCQISSHTTVSKSLVSVSDPWRAFWADKAPLKGPCLTRLVHCFWNYRDSKDPVRWIALSAEVPGHRQQQLTQTLIVRLLKTHFFTSILEFEKSTE